VTSRRYVMRSVSLKNVGDRFAASSSELSDHEALIKSEQSHSYEPDFALTGH
jgi:hypothetical protein